MANKTCETNRVYSSADLVYTVIEAADILRTAEGRVYDLINNGYLKTITIGSQKIRRADLEYFISHYEDIVEKNISNKSNIKIVGK